MPLRKRMLRWPIEQLTDLGARSITAHRVASAPHTKLPSLSLLSRLCAMKLFVVVGVCVATSIAAECGGTYTGCFKDIVPAPGVPPVRVVDHLLTGPTQNMSVAQCATDCAAHGYYYFGLTGHAGAYFCYCGCAENKAAPATANKTCAAPCAGAEEPTGHCGHDSCMAAYKINCTTALPPSPICGGGGGLPAGPACSQKAAQKWKFCDTTASLHDRVTDLVNRITGTALKAQMLNLNPCSL